jgi:hypothetical protein
MQAIISQQLALAANPPCHPEAHSTGDTSRSVDELQSAQHERNEALEALAGLSTQDASLQRQVVSTPHMIEALFDDVLALDRICDDDILMMSNVQGTCRFSIELLANVSHSEQVIRFLLQPLEEAEMREPQHVSTAEARVHTLVRVAQRDNEEETVLHVCRVLFAISSIPSGQHCLHQQRTVFVLQSWIRSAAGEFSTMVQAAACGALANLAVYKPAKEEMVTKDGVLATLVYLSRFPSARVQSQVVRCLRALAVSEENRAAMAGKEMVECWLRLLDSPRDSVPRQTAGVY